jgi:hypothetical protein
LQIPVISTGYVITHMGISTCVGGSNSHPTNVQGTNLYKLPKLVRIEPKRGGTLQVMGISTGFSMPIPVLVSHTGIGIWIFSAVAVSHFVVSMLLKLCSLLFQSSALKSKT